MSSSLIQSRFLKNCSISTATTMVISFFVSARLWNKLEEDVHAASGLLVMYERKLIDTLRLFKKNMTTAEMNCMVISLSVYNGIKVESFLTGEHFLGEVIVKTPKNMFRSFKHILDLLREVYVPLDYQIEEMMNGCHYPDNVMVVFCINQTYRVSNKPPNEIEECYLSWAADGFKIVDVIDLCPFSRVLPRCAWSLTRTEHLIQE